MKVATQRRFTDLISFALLKKGCRFPRLPLLRSLPHARQGESGRFDSLVTLLHLQDELQLAFVTSQLSRY
jgi:hypothetical protein